MALCSSGPVTCITTSVAPRVLQGHHIFGHQQAVFPDVPLHLDLVLVVRVYLDGGKSHTTVGSVQLDAGEAVIDQRSVTPDHRSGQSRSKSAEEKVGVLEDKLSLVAWTFLPLAVHGETESLFCVNI